MARTRSRSNPPGQGDLLGPSHVPDPFEPGPSTL